MGDVRDVLLMGAGMALILGTGAAYLVQIVPVVRRRSAAGINPWSIALTVLSSIFLAVNVLVTQYTGADPGGVVPLAQVGVSIPIAFSLLVCIGHVDPSREWVWACATCAALGAVPLLALVGVVAMHGDYLAEGGMVFGILAALVTVVIWLPQIYTLLRWREIGELSLAFLLFETIGAILVLAYQATEFGISDGWTSWLTGLVQVVELLILVSIYVAIRLKSRKTDETPDVIEFIGEDTEMSVFSEDKEE